MPELPEVETVRGGLQKHLVGHTITAVEVRLPKIFSGNPKTIVGAHVLGVRRFGKGLVIDLDNLYSVAAHIKLTGQFIYTDPTVKKTVRLATRKVGESLPNAWTHVVFYLDKQAHLYYNDIRQFGWLKVVKTKEVKELPFFKALGPEPPMLSKNVDGKTLLTGALFTEIVKKGKGPIKPLLMDQKKISGIGNIYANDALFLANIDPRRIAQSLSEEEIHILSTALLTVLKRGLQYGGASEIHFVNALGEEGSYQKHFLVYAQEDKPCKTCKTPIEKITLAGRGTYFCSSCQH